jgi:hypothetical protein
MQTALRPIDPLHGIDLLHRTGRMALISIPH